jgi:uncharacterized protein (TIGR03000 family)
MYSVVLATMMTVTPSTPDTFLTCHGCWGCYGCHGCWGYNCFGCYGGCYGCCGGCWGCYGCYGCYGCWGGFGYTCHGCYGGSCAGCYGYAAYAPPAYCYGCYGGVVPADPGKKLPKPKEEKDKETTARVTITAPPGLRLTVDGQPLALQTPVQTFETPALEPGHTYSYVFRAEGLRDGKAAVRERKVTVRAGEAARVDFTDLTAKAPARVTVVLPSDARLIVEGVTYTEGAAKRTFDTPDLEAGRTYAYLMRAEVTREGRVLKQEQRVQVEAAKEVTVEFKELPALQAAQR